MGTSGGYTLVYDLRSSVPQGNRNILPISDMQRVHAALVLVAGVFGGGNASSAVLTAFIMAANKEPYIAAAECITSVVHKAMPHAAHFVEQLELYASLGSMMAGHR